MPTGPAMAAGPNVGGKPLNSGGSGGGGRVGGTGSGSRFSGVRSSSILTGSGSGSSRDPDVMTAEMSAFAQILKAMLLEAEGALL